MYFCIFFFCLDVGGKKVYGLYFTSIFIEGVSFILDNLFEKNNFKEIKLYWLFVDRFNNFIYYYFF